VAPHPLGLIKGHFSVERGFNSAAYLCPLVLDTHWDGFRGRFGGEMDEGRVVIAGWSHVDAGGEKERSLAAVIVAGEDRARVGGSC
jgi:hypothetical protein